MRVAKFIMGRTVWKKVMKIIIRHQVNSKMPVQMAFKWFKINFMMMGYTLNKIIKNNKQCKYLINMRSTSRQKIKSWGRRKIVMTGIKQLRGGRRIYVKINQCLDYCHQKVANRWKHHQKQELQVPNLKCLIINVVHSKTIRM